MKRILLGLLVLINASAFAQTNTETNAEDTVAPQVTLTVDKDDRIDILLDKKISITKVGTVIPKTTSTEKVTIDKYHRVRMMGYRLQVMNSTDRGLVYAAKAKLYQLYPHQKQTVVAQAPFFKLRFGNFTTKEEAEKYRKALSSMFPSGVYVIKDFIEGRLQPDNKPDVKKEVTKKETKKK
jgi:septal ring-binding cell division protein DamX